MSQLHPLVPFTDCPQHNKPSGGGDFGYSHSGASSGGAYTGTAPPTSYQPGGQHNSAPQSQHGYGSPSPAQQHGGYGGQQQHGSQHGSPAGQYGGGQQQHGQGQGQGQYGSQAGYGGQPQQQQHGGYGTPGPGGYGAQGEHILYHPASQNINQFQQLATEVLHPRAAKAIMAAPRTTTTTSTTSTEARHTRTRDLQARAATVALHPEVMVVSTAVRLVAMAASREDMAAHSSPGGSLTRIP